MTENPLDLTGWSNLTEAIQKDPYRIDWEVLDGVQAKCVHLKLGILTYKLERDPDFPTLNHLGAWFRLSVHPAWRIAFQDAWRGRGGWSLYVKGEVPLKKLTADTLPDKTVFRGLPINHHESRGNWMVKDGEQVFYLFGSGASHQHTNEWRVFEICDNLETLANSALKNR